MLLLFIVLTGLFKALESSCPAQSIVEPCSCVRTIPSQIYNIFNYEDPHFNQTRARSIICENLAPSFPLELVFLRLGQDAESTGDPTVTEYDTFVLANSSYTAISANLFGRIRFRRIFFKNNPLLTTINENAFRFFEDEIESFGCSFSRYSNPFSLLRRFVNLRFVGFHDNRIRSIPSRAFNHSYLSRIWFGIEGVSMMEPIVSIGDYAFTNLPRLYFIRISSPRLSVISKYAFAQEQRATGEHPMLELYLSGKALHAASFAMTSLSRFRSRFVFLRFYHTSITYFDENVFQPFLESHPNNIITIDPTSSPFQCACESQWIQKDYFMGGSETMMDNRVYGYPCWTYDFSLSCAPLSSSSSLLKGKNSDGDICRTGE